jgi:superfamily II DNA helicase RecQ
MQYAFFKISTTSPSVGSHELNQFIKTHRIVNVEKQFHSEGADGYWSFCLQWQEQYQESSTARDASKIDYKAVLSAEQFAIFSLLRERRKQIAEQDGVPVYAVATNEHLAEMVRGSVTSKAELQKISGFGTSKIERYGNLFLETIRNAVQSLERDSKPETHSSESTDAQPKADRSN